MLDVNEVISCILRNDYENLVSVLDDINVNMIDDEGFSPLIHSVLCDSADTRIVRELINCGADVNYIEPGRNYSALHFSARDQKTDIVELLLDSGANVNAEDSQGCTPLLHCVLHSAGQMSTIELLLLHGADPFAKDNTNKSTYDLALLMGNKELQQLFGR